MTALFRQLSAEDVAFVASVKKGHVLRPPRQEILAAGAVEGSLFTLFEGWAFRYKALSGGGRQILDILLPGDLIGLQGTLRGVHGHSVAALTRVQLCVLDPEAARRLFAERIDLALDVARMLCAEEDRADMRMVMLGRLSATERLAYFLLDIFDRLAARRLVEGNASEFPLTHTHLADALGISRVQATRSLGDLRDRELALVSRGRLVIVNRSALARLAGYVPPDKGAGRLIL